MASSKHCRALSYSLRLNASSPSWNHFWALGTACCEDSGLCPGPKTPKWKPSQTPLPISSSSATTMASPHQPLRFAVVGCPSTTGRLSGEPRGTPWITGVDPDDTGSDQLLPEAVPPPDWGGVATESETGSDQLPPEGGVAPAPPPMVSIGKLQLPPEAWAGGTAGAEPGVPAALGRGRSQPCEAWVARPGGVASGGGARPCRAETWVEMPRYLPRALPS